MCDRASREWVSKRYGIKYLASTQHSSALLVFRSGNGVVQVTLTNVAHVPDLRYYLFSLTTLVKHGHTFEGRPTGIVVKLKSERMIVFPLTGILHSLYGYRNDCDTRGNACAVLVPGKLPNKPGVNVNY